MLKKHLSLLLLCLLSVKSNAFDVTKSHDTLIRYKQYFDINSTYTPTYTLASFKKHINNTFNADLHVNDELDDSTISMMNLYLDEANMTKLTKLVELYEMPFTEKSKWIDKVLKESQEIIARKDQKFIIVNIPEFTATAYNLHADGITYSVAMETPVIIGKTTRKTPRMTSNIIGVKFNPTWSPPPTILKQDVFKHGKLNHEYIRKHKLYAYHDGKKIDLDSLNKKHEQPSADENFDEYTTQSNSTVKSDTSINVRSLKFMQPPGTDNALGVLKFELDNNQNIYLHDTNQHNLFNEKIRALSSGCVRVKNYKELASWVLDKNLDDVEQSINTHKTAYVKSSNIPVHIVYWPLKVKNNAVIFLNNIYKEKLSNQ